MNRTEEKIHLLLHGKTLLDDWVEACRLWDAGKELWDESDRLSLLDNRSRDIYRMQEMGSKLRDKGTKIWYNAVRAEFGIHCRIEWQGVGKNCCILSNGEVYNDADCE